MAQDYKHSRARTKKSTPAWVWLAIGFAMGLAVALLVYLRGQEALERATKDAGSAPVANAPAVQSTEPEEIREESHRSFDFYTLLPELEVVVPDDEPTPRRSGTSTQAPPQQSKPATDTGSGTYILQVGSFQRHQEADSLKARLALLGTEAQIQTVRVERETWHRVRLGPYRSLAEANRIRARLRKNKIEAILLQVRG